MPRSVHGVSTECPRSATECHPCMLHMSGQLVAVRMGLAADGDKRGGARAQGHHSSGGPNVRQAMSRAMPHLVPVAWAERSCGDSRTHTVPLAPSRGR